MSAEKNNYILETVGISKVIKKKHRMEKVVSDVSISINIGELVVVFGPVGSGKTSMLSMILGIEKPDIGEVIMRGENLYDYSPEEIAFIRLRKMGIVTKDTHWIMGLNVLDNLAFPMRVAGQKDKNIKSQIKKMAIDLSIDIKNINFIDLEEISKRKLAIFREIVKKPWILFLDEPAEGLTEKDTTEIFRFIKEINKKYRTSIMLLTHNVEHLKITNKWFFMKEGSIEDITSSENPIQRLKKAINIVEIQENNKKKNVF